MASPEENTDLSKHMDRTAKQVLRCIMGCSTNTGICTVVWHSEADRVDKDDGYNFWEDGGKTSQNCYLCLTNIFHNLLTNAKCDPDPRASVVGHRNFRKKKKTRSVAVLKLMTGCFWTYFTLSDFNKCQFVNEEEQCKIHYRNTKENYISES